jgi:hypothetical protein
MTAPKPERHDVDLIAETGFLDPCYFLSNFLPHWFPDEIPWFHRGIISIVTKKVGFLDGYKKLDKIIRHFVDQRGASLFSVVGGKVRLKAAPYVSIILPRGFSKTTLLNGLNLWSVLYQMEEFIVYLSETATHSEMQLENVKAEIEVNERITAVFGGLKPAQREGTWAQGEAEFRNGRIIMAKGRGAQVRGMNYRGRRPSLILLDDVEDQESVSTPAQLEKTRNWFFAAVEPAMQMRKSKSIIALGTLLHSEALLAKFQNNPMFTSVTLGVYDKDGDLLWPEHFNSEAIEAKKASYASAGQLNTFYREYYSQIRNEESQKFKQRYIQYEAVPDDEKIVGTAIACDPAISNKPGAACFGLAAVSMTQGGKIYVRDVFLQVGVTPREQIDLYFQYYRTYRPLYAGVESIAYQAALVHLLREEMFRRKLYFEITPITHSIKKEERIEGILQPRYAAGYVKHCQVFPEYEKQLLDYPNGLVDGPDVVAMAVALLDPYAAAAADPTKDLGEDEMEPLDDVIPDWRAI